MTPSLSRRRLLQLSTVAVIFSAGCLGDDYPDLFLFNQTGESVSVSTTVVRMPDNEQLLEDTTTIPENDSHQYGNPITEPGTYQIQVSVEGGDESSHEWEAPQDEGTGLHIRINSERIEFVQVIAE